MTSPPPDYHGDNYMQQQQQQQQQQPPPALPPRYSSGSYANWQTDSSIMGMASHDPRTSSQQSLIPDPASENTGRRRLLLVYLHGFMGDETSFRSFPAHLHNLVTITLAESHIVHTKIYPKYRSRNALEVARDDFSAWLTPNETPWTDIVLLGHSMGGLLAADITLLFRHKIIGVINFDVPFLGMHPGIVKAGLTSIFKPWPAPEDQGQGPEGSDKKPSRMNTLFNPKPSDPHYNPTFENDVRLPVRKGWENALHFMSKHSNGLIQASKGLVKSHLEFGGAMADYKELKDRYARVRALEVDDEGKRSAANPGVRSPPRIRFVNYYTASTGRPKKPKSIKSPKSPRSPSPSRPSSRGPSQSFASIPEVASASQLTVNTQLGGPADAISPHISVEEHRGNQLVPVTPQEPPSATTPTNESPLRDVSPQPLSRSSNETEIPQAHVEAPDLPSIPPIPREPPFVDIAQFTDKAARKTAEKEYSRSMKEYQREVKARNKIINERSDMQEKWEKQQEKERIEALTRGGDSKADSGHESDNLEESFGGMQVGVTGHPHIPGSNAGGPYGNYDFSRSAILSQPSPDDRAAMSDTTAPSSQYADSTHTLTTTDTNTSTTTGANTPPKKKRFKKFCMLPPKDAQGNKDPTWVRVFMEGVDEVTAHTTLFFVSDSYERLVGDVGARIEDWIRENESMRVVREMEGMY